MGDNSSLYQSIRRYNEYMVKFVEMQQQGNYSPISAYERPDGEITGFLYLMSENNAYTLSVEEVLNRMHDRFEKSLAAGEINSYAIFYHSQFSNDGNHAIALRNEELKAITISYGLHNGEQGKIALSYTIDNENITYRGFPDFSTAENNEIFNTPIKADKNYFTDREEVSPPVFINEAGIKIFTSNTQSVHNTWCGIFGFESFRKEGGGQVLMEYLALGMTLPPVYSIGSIKISQSEFADVIFKSIIVNENAVTILPVIKTNYTIAVKIGEIDVWENVDNLEAIVSCAGRGDFGLSYFATDYAENREQYHAQKDLNVQISGIAFVLDMYKAKKGQQDFELSDDFTAYMPSKDLPNYACFDFIGELEDFRETHLLMDNSLHGYILKVRLITHPEIRDYFTIDIFALPENMRFKQLSKGMKISGMVQLQGRIGK